MDRKPKILVIKTGGTITMVRSADGTLGPYRDDVKLLDAVPEARTLADIDVLPLANIDSSNVRPPLWQELARAIYARIGAYDGFVVTHGTDTLAYTAAALSFMLQELDRPVVVTGAQVPLEEVGSDARANLINAVRVAAADVAGVLVVFGTNIIRGTRAKKTSAFDLQAFTSVNEPPAGTIGLSIKFAPGTPRRNRKKPLLRDFLNPRVAMTPVYPGVDPAIIDHLAATHAGVVVEGYGAGHIPTDDPSPVSAIRGATARGVPVVVCTRCLLGSTEMERYQIGRAALDAGAIPAMDMTPEAAHVKLMWVLGQTGDMKTIESLMLKSFAGEIREHL